MSFRNYLPVLICISIFSYGQDQIFKKDNTRVEAKIVEVTPKEIKYKLFSNDSGDTLSILKKDLSVIIYQNGKYEVIDNYSNQPVATPNIKYLPYKNPKPYKDSLNNIRFKELTVTKNLVSINLLDPLNGTIGFSYIREFPNKHCHLYVPISVGFSTPRLSYPNDNFYGDKWGFGPDYLNDLVPIGKFSVDDFKYDRKSYDLGLGVHYQTGKRNGISYFIGPFVGMSQFTGTYTELTTEIFNGNSSWRATHYQQKNFILTRTNILLDNGVLCRINKNLNITFLVGVGYHSQKFEGQDLTKANNFSPGPSYYLTHKFNLSVGYRF